MERLESGVDKFLFRRDGAGTDGPCDSGEVSDAAIAAVGSCRGSGCGSGFRAPN